MILYKIRKCLIYFFSMDAKRSSSELNRQIVKERHSDIHLKMKASAELYYIKIAEAFTFLDMYSGICGYNLRDLYVSGYDMKASSEILALGYPITSMNSGKWYVSFGSNMAGNTPEIQYKCALMF